MYYFYEPKSINPRYNLAFEEYLLKNKPQDNIFILWQNSDSVIVGLNQVTEQEVNVEYAKENNIQIVRRTTGGGAVFHDLGNINYSFIEDLDSKEEFSVKKYSNIICDALLSLKINANVTGRNDITVNGKKISGVAQRIHGNRLLHHGTLVYDVNAEKLNNVLSTSTSKYTSKSTNSVKKQIGNIKEMLSEEISTAEFYNIIKKTVMVDDFQLGYISSSDEIKINELKKEKYDTWYWNFGREPKYEYTNSTKFESGTIVTKLNVSDGRIEDICFHGDYMSRIPNDELCRSLIGKLRQKDDINIVLDSFDINEMFGINDRELLLKLILG